jgi:hypothetical protein
LQRCSAEAAPAPEAAEALGRAHTAAWAACVAPLGLRSAARRTKLSARAVPALSAVIRRVGCQRRRPGRRSWSEGEQAAQQAPRRLALMAAAACFCCRPRLQALAHAAERVRPTPEFDSIVQQPVGLGRFQNAEKTAFLSRLNSDRKGSQRLSAVGNSLLLWITGHPIPEPIPGWVLRAGCATPAWGD